MLTRPGYVMLIFITLTVALVRFWIHLSFCEKETHSCLASNLILPLTLWHQRLRLNSRYRSQHLRRVVTVVKKSPSVLYTSLSSSRRSMLAVYGLFWQMARSRTHWLRILLWQLPRLVCIEQLVLQSSLDQSRILQCVCWRRSLCRLSKLLISILRCCH